MAQGAHGFPAALGDKIRRIDKNYYKYRAYEWKIWNDILMPILMHDRLPTYHYHNLTGGAEAMAIACSTCVSLVEVDKVQKLLEQFTEYYEGSFYKYDWARLGAMRSIFHHLLHVPDYLQQCGPLWNLWQLPMERMCGQLSG